MPMLKRPLSIVAFVAFALPMSAAHADEYTDTANLFRNAGQSGTFFNKSYGYAVFPIGIGGAFGKGHVFVKGKPVGETSMTQASIGFQLGGQGFSQIIFFEDERAFREFSKGNFEFGADASAVAITAAAGASASTTGASASASGGKKDAVTAGGYHKGFATFTIVKGGLMYEAAIAGQKFSYKKL